MDQLTRVEATVDRIEILLAKLFAALAEDDEEPPAVDLEGQPAGEERDINNPL